MISLSTNGLLGFLTFILSVLLAWLSDLTTITWHRYNPQNNVVVLESPEPSSVWCHFGPSRERVCKFNNVCYNPQFQEFQFVVTEESILSGVSKPESWMDINMSTVLGHNAFKMKLSLISSKNRNRGKFVRIQHSPTFIIHRFKPDNIMHVIHDDLIPLHFTVESMFGKSAILEKKISLAFTDRYHQSPLDKWYSQFSALPIQKLAFVNETVCFDELYVGLYQSTLFFNYGFGQPQGPVLNENFNVRGVMSFINSSFHLWQTKFDPSCAIDILCTKVIVMVRSQTRRILNLDSLKKAIERAHNKTYPKNQLEMVEVDEGVHDVSFILSHLRHAKLVVGMHGAGMILSLFLPPDSTIVELFPFGINPENVSFLRALSLQPLSYPLHYKYWRNMDRDKSVPSIQNDPLLGKISHLSQSVQMHITSVSEVPAVKCCHDPAYLYYIFHDTLINDEVFYSIHQAFEQPLKSKIGNHLALYYHLFPAFPSFLKCEISDQRVSVTWGEMSNFSENEGIWFQITFLLQGHVLVENVTDSASKRFSLKLKSKYEDIQIWFQPYNKYNINGHVKHINCID